MGFFSKYNTLKCQNEAYTGATVSAVLSKTTLFTSFFEAYYLTNLTDK